MSVEEPPTVQSKDSASRRLHRHAATGTDRSEAVDAVPRVPGYTLHRVIGRGGMGEVWEATEHRFDRTVALKVHHRSFGAHEATSEAKLAARIAHPGIVPVHDVGETLDGRAFYTMDRVEGTELRALMQDGPMKPSQAAAIAAEIADAVEAAHRRGIVHCDLKPGNVMVDEGRRVRILDFGLAGILVGSDRGIMAAGTPPYMSPEQVAGLPVGTASDVYSIGVVLYQMLAGRLPLTADSIDELIGRIVAEIPPPPSTHVASVPRDLDRIVLACLEKQPEQRYPTARMLFEQLTAFNEGRPFETARSRYVPKASSGEGAAAVVTPPTGSTLRFRWSWMLESPPDAIWPFVANTERFNRAAGLPAVEFDDHVGADGGSRRTGAMRALGMTVRWDEHPFEWTRYREHSVYRAYTEGPLAGLWNRVELLPREGGGTELVHEVRVEPRGWLGRIAATLEIKWKAGRRFERVYRHIDAYLKAPRDVEDDAFEERHRPSGSQKTQVSRGVTDLLGRGFSPAIGERIRDLLLFGPDKRLERLRPYELADRWGTPREETLDAFIHAADVGLVDLGWDLLCTSCMLPHATTSSLSDVGSSGSCIACNRDVDRDLACSVELIFRPHPSVRRVELSTYCIGAPALRPHVVAQQVIGSEESRRFTVVMDRGEYRVAGPRMDSSLSVSASPSGFASSCEVSIRPERTDGSPVVVKSGEVEWKVENLTPFEQIVRIEQTGRREDAVTACMAMSHAAFADLFPSEVVAPEGQLTVSRIAFLWVGATTRFELVRSQGDAGAFNVLSQIERLMISAVRSHVGAMVSTTDDPLLAAFASEEDAVAAALALLDAFRAAELSPHVRLAVHAGRCIAVHRAGRIGYFGQTLLRGAALLSDASEGGLVVSGEVADQPRPLSLLYGALVNQSGLAGGLTTSEAEPYPGRRIFKLGC